MSTPVSEFIVQTVNGPTTVTAQSFSITATGALVLCSAASQTIAAFAPGDWINVLPVVNP